MTSGVAPCLESLETRALLSVTAEEQLFIYLLNRARHDPGAYEEETDMDVDLSGITAQPPLAVNEDLFESARFHSDEMAAEGYLAHQSPVTNAWPNKLARDAGYALPADWTDDDNYIESIAGGYVTPQTALYELIRDFNVDPPGHRIHLLGTIPFHADNREIGVARAVNLASPYRVYWTIHATRRDTADRFLTGVVYDDLNSNGRFDLDEGLGGVTVSAGEGLATTTNDEGGWSIPVPDGTYAVTATGGGFQGTGTISAAVAGKNVEVDFVSAMATGYVNFAEFQPQPQAAVKYGPKKLPVANGQAKAVNFGRLRVGGKVKTIKFYIFNTGQLPLTVGRVRVPKGFSLVAAPKGPVAPGRAAIFTVRLNTRRAGKFAGAIRFSTNDPDDAAFSIRVAGQVLGKSRAGVLTAQRADLAGVFRA